MAVALANALVLLMLAQVPCNACGDTYGGTYEIPKPRSGKVRCTRYGGYDHVRQRELGCASTPLLKTVAKRWNALYGN